MSLKVYLETTIPSYLTSRPSRDLLIAGHQQVTQIWWDDHRHDYELYISQLVIMECKAGNAGMAKKRMELLAGISALEIGPESLELARKLITIGPLPAKAENDAFHIAVAAVNAMDFLLTWNMRHIANAFMRRDIDALCRQSGFEPPVICTPDTLLAEEDGETHVEGPYS
jgi:hypothetical protein